MTILYASPVFSDYRIPFYNKLNELFNGEFYIMYSPLRFEMEGLNNTLKKIPIQLKDIAYPYNDEKIFKIKKSSKQDFDKYYRIPYLQHFYKNLSRYNPKILITEGFFQWTPAVVLYAWLHRYPVFISYERTAHTERFAPFFKILERKFLDKFVTGYLVNGTETTNYLKSLNINPQKIHITGMSADSDGLKKGISSITQEIKVTMRSNLNINGEGITFLFSGQFIERKGIKYLLNAWIIHSQKYPSDHLILIGGGELLEPLKKEFENKKNIHFIGKILYDEVYKYYAISDVFIIPTLEDNWCLVVPEAMACGMPIACSKYNGGAIDLIKNKENGVIFDPLEQSSILDSLKFFHNKDLKTMGKHSIEIEEYFNTENCANRFFNVIRTYLNK